MIDKEELLKDSLKELLKIGFIKDGDGKRGNKIYLKVNIPVPHTQITTDSLYEKLKSSIVKGILSNVLFEKNQKELDDIEVVQLNIDNLLNIINDDYINIMCSSLLSNMISDELIKESFWYQNKLEQESSGSGYVYKFLDIYKSKIYNNLILPPNDGEAIIFDDIYLSFGDININESIDNITWGKIINISLELYLDRGHLKSVLFTGGDLNKNRDKASQRDIKIEQILKPDY